MTVSLYQVLPYWCCLYQSGVGGLLCLLKVGILISHLATILWTNFMVWVSASSCVSTWSSIMIHPSVSDVRYKTCNPQPNWTHKIMNLNSICLNPFTTISEPLTPISDILDSSIGILCNWNCVWMGIDMWWTESLWWDLQCIAICVISRYIDMYAHLSVSNSHA